MPRITGVSEHEGGLGTRIAFFFTRRDMSRITGRAPDRMLEPVEVYAHIPGLLRAYGRLEQATGRLKQMDQRYMALAAMKTATLVTCEYCIDLGSQISRRLGLTDEELLALPRYQDSPLFDETDRIVIDYAVGMTRTPAEVPDELFTKLTDRFEDSQIVELTHLIAMENMRGRFGIGLDIGAAGFSEGMVCALPIQPE
ncbi:MAG: carboxymuconolactone decarboxylase family protein [Acidimicrobiia bacterium]